MRLSFLPPSQQSEREGLTAAPKPTDISLALLLRSQSTSYQMRAMKHHPGWVQAKTNPRLTEQDVLLQTGTCEYFLLALY